MRRRGGSDLEELVPAPAPDAEVWGVALLDALAAVVGTELAFATSPVPLPHHEGPWAFGCELAPLGGGSVPPGWTGPLVVRVADAPQETARELAAIEANGAGGLGAPRVLASVLLDNSGAGAGPVARSALVTAPPPGTPLPELIGYNLHQSGELLDGFAHHHAAIGSLPVRDLEGVPTIAVADELARIDRAQFGEQLDWLEARIPGPGPLVLCHGGYQPLCVSGPGPEGWDAVGGPGHGLSATNWGGAVLAEREFDVAFTLVAFWFAPHFAPNRSERTAIKMIRNTLSNTYKLAYEEAVPLDGDRLRFWQAFHAVRGMARVAAAYDTEGSPFATGDRGPLPGVLGPELGRYFRMQHRP
jgi:hypothetical protein